MVINMKKIILCAVTLLVCSPVVTHAFVASNQAAFVVDEQHALYVLEFELGHSQHETRVPTFSQQGIGMATNTISFLFDGAAIDGSTKVVSGLFSTAPQREGQYVVAAGTKATFTFAVLVETEQDGLFPRAVRVTAVPFTLHSIDTSWQNGLSVGELASFYTPTLLTK